MNKSLYKLVFIFIALCSFSQIFSQTYTWNDFFEESRWQSTSWNFVGWPGNGPDATAVFSGAPVLYPPLSIGPEFPNPIVALNITDGSYSFEGTHPTFGGDTIGTTTSTIVTLSTTGSTTFNDQNFADPNGPTLILSNGTVQFNGGNQFSDVTIHSGIFQVNSGATIDSVTPATMAVNGGIVNSQGTLAINATFGDGSTFQIGPDDEVHAAESEKTWVFDSGSTFEVNIKAGVADTLTISDPLTMNTGSILKVNIIAGVVQIQPLDEFQFTLGGEFEAFNGTVIDNDQDLEFEIEIRDGNGFIVALSNGIVVPIGPLTPNQEAVKHLITDPDPNNTCLLNVATALIGDGSLDQFATNLDRYTPYIYSLNNFFQIQNALWGAQSILRQSPLTLSEGCNNSNKQPTILPLFLYGHANAGPHQPGGDSYSEGLQAIFPFNDLANWGQGENILSADTAMTYLFEKGFYYPVSGSSNQNTLLTTGAINLTNSFIGGELSLVSEYGLTGNTIHDTTQYLDGTETTARSFYLSQTFLIGVNAMLAPHQLYAPPYMKKRETIRHIKKQKTAHSFLQILPSIGLNTAWQWNGGWEEQGAACFDRTGQKQREVWMMPNAMIHFLIDLQTMKGRYCILPSLSTGWEGIYPLEKNQQIFGLKKDLTSFATVTTNPGTRRNINQFRINANLTMTNSRYFSAALNVEIKLFSGITQGNFSASLSNLF